MKGKIIYNIIERIISQAAIYKICLAFWSISVVILINMIAIQKNWNVIVSLLVILLMWCTIFIFMDFRDWVKQNGN